MKTLRERILGLMQTAKTDEGFSSSEILECLLQDGESDGDVYVNSVRKTLVRSVGRGEIVRSGKIGSFLYALPNPDPAKLPLPSTDTAELRLQEACRLAKKKREHAQATEASKSKAKAKAKAAKGNTAEFLEELLARALALQYSILLELGRQKEQR